MKREIETSDPFNELPKAATRPRRARLSIVGGVPPVLVITGPLALWSFGAAGWMDRGNSHNVFLSIWLMLLISTWWLASWWVWYGNKSRVRTWVELFTMVVVVIGCLLAATLGHGSGSARALPWLVGVTLIFFAFGGATSKLVDRSGAVLVPTPAKRAGGPSTADLFVLTAGIAIFLTMAVLQIELQQPSSAPDQPVIEWLAITIVTLVALNVVHPVLLLTSYLVVAGCWKTGSVRPIQTRESVPLVMTLLFHLAAGGMFGLANLEGAFWYLAFQVVFGLHLSLVLAICFREWKFETPWDVET